jgi:hypothetical protein
LKEQSVMHRYASVIVVFASLAWLIPAATDAALCQKKNGTLMLRDACGRRETPVTADMLGVSGTPGPQGEQGERGPKGEPGEQGAKGDPTAPFVVYDLQIPSAYIGTAAGNGLTVASLGLPAGKYLVIAKTDAVNFGTATYLRCGLDVGANRVSVATTFIGATGGDGVGIVETLTLLAPVDAGAGATVYVRCRPDAATGTNESAYMESGILTAIPVSAINAQ